MLEKSKWAFLGRSVEPRLLFQLIACVIVFPFFRLACIVQTFNGTCYAPKTVFYFTLVFFSFNSFSFSFIYLFRSFFLILFFLVSFFQFLPNFRAFISWTNLPSERANINSASFAYTVSTLEATLRGFRAASPPSCSSWTRVYVLGPFQFYHTQMFSLYKLRRRPLFGHRYTFLSALFWFPSVLDTVPCTGSLYLEYLYKIVKIVQIMTNQAHNRLMIDSQGCLELFLWLPRTDCVSEYPYKLEIYRKRNA